MSRSIREHAMRSEVDIIRALEEKRRLLEQEVIAFKALKDKEFKDYEEELRSRVDNDEKTVEEDTLEKDKQEKAEKDTSTQSGGPPTETPSKIHLPPSSPARSVDSSDGSGSSANTTPTDEREIELRSLFTPSYLPLLEEPRKRGKRNKSLSPARQSSGKRQIPTSSPLSSSLTLSSEAKSASSGSHKHANKPPFAGPPLSRSRKTSSPERLNRKEDSRPSMGDRRSSSRSDSSARSPGLRSAIKQPKSPEQEDKHRDKKHVLFHINNIIISPSSSPVLSRQGPNGSQGESSTSTANTGGTDRSEKSENENEADGYFDQSYIDDQELIDAQFRRITPSSSLPTPSVLSQSMSSYQKTYDELVQPTVTTPPVTAGEEDDFNMAGGGDPLFEFDEDHKDMGGYDDDAEKSKTSPNDDDSDEEVPQGAQSPYAGSLPIEIKWPGRK